MNVLADLKNRGVADVFFVVCDGLKGLPDSVNAVFPAAIVQACVIHLIRATPGQAALGMLPQVVVLLAAGPFVDTFVEAVGLDRAAWLSAVAVVAGLAVYALLSNSGYIFVAVALVLEAAGLRVVGVVAGLNVLRGLPKNRTSIGAALVDTATEVATGVGIAIAGTVLAAFFTGSIATHARFTARQTREFHETVTTAGLGLTAVAAALVAWAIARTRGGADPAGNDATGAAPLLERWSVPREDPSELVERHVAGDLDALRGVG